MPFATGFPLGAGGGAEPSGKAKSTGKGMNSMGLVQMPGDWGSRRSVGSELGDVLVLERNMFQLLSPGAGGCSQWQIQLVFRPSVYRSSGGRPTSRLAIFLRERGELSEGQAN